MKRTTVLIVIVVVAATALIMSGCGVSQTDYDAALAQVSGLQAQVQSLESDVTGLTADLTALQEQYDAAAADIAALQAVYPAHEFASYDELEDWLQQNDVSTKPITSDASGWYGRAVELQMDALADGYLVSVDYDHAETEGYYKVWCTTVIDGTIYYWDPETDDINEEITLVGIYQSDGGQ